MAAEPDMSEMMGGADGADGEMPDMAGMAEMLKGMGGGAGGEGGDTGMPDMASLMAMMGKGGGKGGGMGGMADMMGGKGGGKGMGGGGPDPNADKEREEDGYKWSQKGDEVMVTFALEEAANKKEIAIVFKNSSLKVTVKGNVLLEGTLGGKVEVDECTWTIANAGAELQVMLTKQDEKATWNGLMQ